MEPQHDAVKEAFRGSIAAFALLAAAAANPSLLGLLFLVGFCAWSLLCLPRACTPQGLPTSIRLWGAVSGLTLVVLLLQTWVQLVLAAGLVPGMQRAGVRGTLRMLGFPRAETVLQLAALLVTPLLALLAAVRQVQRDRKEEWQQRRQRVEGVELGSIRGGRGSRHNRMAVLRAVHASVGVVARTSLLLCALPSPCVLVLPHALSLGLSLWAWSGEKGSWGPGPGYKKWLHAYTGALVVLQYAWQVLLYKLTWLHPAASFLGLVHLSQGAPAAVMTPEVLKAVGLVLLALCMGPASSARPAAPSRPELDPIPESDSPFTAPDSPQGWVAGAPPGRESMFSRLLALTSALHGRSVTPRQRWQDGTFSGRTGGSDSEETLPLLASPRSPYNTGISTLGSTAEDVPPVPPRDGAEGSAAGEAWPTGWRQTGMPLLSWAPLLLPLLSEGALACFEQLAASPACTAALLCACALLQPSAIGGTVLLLGLTVLLSRPGRGWSRGTVLQQYSRLLCGALLLWTLGCFIATSVAPTLGSSDIAEALGVHAFSGARVKGAAGVPLLVLLLTTAAVGVLARDLQWRGERCRRAGAVRRTAGEAGVCEVHDAGEGAGAGGPGEPREVLPAAVHSPTLSIDPGGGPGLEGSSGEQQGQEADGWRAWGWLWHLTLRTLWCCGFLVVPAAQFVVGGAAYDALHGIYWGGLLLQLAGRTFRLKPNIQRGVKGAPCSHRLMRLYSALHIALLYLFNVGGLPVLNHVLQPEPASRALRALGLWQPSVLTGMVPVLGLLLVACLHAGLSYAVGAAHDTPMTGLSGRAGATSQAGERLEHRHLSLVEGVATWLPPWVVWAGGVAAVGGAAAVALQGYLLLMVDCPVGLLGVLYLGVLLAVLLAPAPGGSWRAEPPGGGSHLAQRPAAGGSPVAGDRGATSHALHAVLLGISEQGAGRAPLRLRLEGGAASSWLPLLALALLAAADFAAQAALPAVAAALRLWSGGFLPGGVRNVLDFLGNVAGLDYQLHGLPLLLALLRPCVLLAAVALYRVLYCLGTAHLQLQRQALGPADWERRRMGAQFGVKALVRRLLVLHSTKLVALAAFAAAVQVPGALGWLLVAGVVLGSLLLGPPRVGDTCPAPSDSAVVLYCRAGLIWGLRGAQAVAAVWMVAQYSLGVDWLRGLASSLSPAVLPWAGWLGLRLVEGSASGELESSLRLKALLLAAVCLKKQAFRWFQGLPQEVVEASRYGAPCPLFWPPSPAHPSAAALRGGAEEGLEGGWLSPRMRDWQPTLVHSLQQAGQDLRRRASAAAWVLLRAMDWPEANVHSARSMQADGRDRGPSSRQVTPVPPFQGSSHLRRSCESESGSGGNWSAARFALQEWVEGFWQGWGLDVCLFLLLLAAFFSLNAISLLLMAGLALGMASSPHTRKGAWRLVVLPGLAVLLLGQYTVLLGWPPVLHKGQPGSPFLGLDEAVEEWLGLRHVSKTALWMLCLAFLASALQVHREQAHASPPPSQHALPGQPHHPRRSMHIRVGSFDCIDSPRAALLPQGSPLLSGSTQSTDSPAGSAPLSSLAEASFKEQVTEQEDHGHTTLSVGAAEPSSKGGDEALVEEAQGGDVLGRKPGGSRGGGTGEAGRGGLAREVAMQRTPAHPTVQDSTVQREGAEHQGCVLVGGTMELWRPLRYDQQYTWRGMDWARYYILRHYLDAVLVAVVALCTLENDIIHAGYLAIALFFFRGRIRLRSSRNRLFRCLPVYNFLVMAITLLYQAPFESLFNWQLDPEEKSCNVAHLLGLYKLEGSMAILSLSYRGVLADVLLWVVIRLQTRLFDAPTYAQVIEVVRQEEAVAQRSAAWEQEWWVAQQAQRAIEESHQKRARAVRLERLKAGVSRGFASSGIDPSMFDQAFVDFESTLQQAQQAQQAEVSSWEAPTPGIDHRTGSWAGTDHRPDPHTSTPAATPHPTGLRAPALAGGESCHEGAGERGGAAAVTSAGAKGNAGMEGVRAEGSGPQRPSPPTAVGSSDVAEPAGDAGTRAGAPTQPRRVVSRAAGWLKARLRRVGRESYLCYLLFLLSFVSRFSLLLLPYPISMLVYSLVSTKPSKAYWQVALMYSEGILIAQYAFLVPTRLGCHFISPELQRSMEVLGIHSRVPPCIPLFLLYLATLMHTYGLATRLDTSATLGFDSAAGYGEAARRSQGSAPSQRQRGEIRQLALDFETRGADAEGSSGTHMTKSRTCVPRHRMSDLHGSEAWQAEREDVAGRVDSWISRLASLSSKLSASFMEFVCRSCTACERGPYLVLATLRYPTQQPQRVLTPEEGSALLPEVVCHVEARMQAVLDAYRGRDIQAAFEKRHQEREGPQGSEIGEGAEGLSGKEYGASGTGSREESSAAGAQRAQQETQGGAAECGAGSWEDGEGGRGGAAVAGGEGGGGDSLGMAGGGMCSAPDLSSIGPLHIRAHKVLAHSPQHSQLSALFEVTPLRSTPANTPGWCNGPGWPLRSLCPGRDAADTLLRYREDVSRSNAGGEEGQGGAVEVLAAEAHSRQAHDWYAATAGLDFLCFIYVALFYQEVVSSARSLSEITSEHVVPLGYLLTLILLFMFIVGDRVVYTLGSPLGKAVLHLSQLGLYFGYCSSLYWSPLTSPSAKNHLRLLILLRSGSFVLSALQLRTGYPPPASYSNGMGRHSFVFMRHVSTLNGAAFQVFAAIPFLYELRELLDWSCTATTLQLGDWLKLQDINNSLFLVACDRKARARRRPGHRQPRYLKFFQGTLLFSGLLLLLWVPLLVFSSGNPTYQIPQILSFSLDSSLLVMDNATTPESTWQYSSTPMRDYQPYRTCSPTSSDPHRTGSCTAASGWGGGIVPGAAAGGAVRFPLYGAGERRRMVQWRAGSNTSTASGLEDTDPSQWQELCLAEDSDSLWALAPPGQQALLSALREERLALRLGWAVERDNPPPSTRGGPQCRGQMVVPLATASLEGLRAVVQGVRSHAQLLRANGTREYSEVGSSRQQGGGGTGASRGLYPLLWMLRGDSCTMAPLLQPSHTTVTSGTGGVAGGGSLAQPWVACNASLQAQEGAVGGPLLAANAKGGWGRWWRLSCQLVDADDKQVESSHQTPCGDGFRGPRLVSVLDRVQTGIIGRTLSSYGIAGLYTVFVYGIGRFLRFSVVNLRMRIPFEDLPNVRRLAALCQDIYIARAEGELALEEELYWTLISIYRLPSLMFELTKKQQ